MLVSCGLTPDTTFRSPLPTQQANFTSPLTEPTPVPLNQTPTTTSTPLPAPTATPAPTFTPNLPTLITTHTLSVTLTSPGEPTPVPLPITYQLGSPQQIYQAGQELVGMIQWVPDSNDQLLTFGGGEAGTYVTQLDLTTGERVILLSTERNLIQPVLFSTTHQIAYLTQIKEDPDQPSIWHLFLQDKNDPTGEGRSVRRNVQQPLIPTLNGAGLWVFDREMTTLTKLNSKGEAQAIFNITIPLPLTNGPSAPFTEYTTEWRDDLLWVILYNYTNVFLFHRETGELREINLGPGGLEYQKRWATCAKWSPAGDKIAFLLTTDVAVPLFYNQVGILNLASQELTLIPNQFRFIYDLTWAPDNRQVLIVPNLEAIEGRVITELFMIDTLTQQLTPYPVLPDATSPYFECQSLTWGNPHRVSIAYFGTEDKGWYNLEVTTNP